MDELQEALKSLKDIHEPQPVSFWPPAPGWWIVLICAPLFILLIRYVYRLQQRPKYKKLATQELGNIVANFEIQHNSHKTAKEISLLLRKVLVLKNKNVNVAGLIGDDWLQYLDEVSGSSFFTQGGGRILKTIPYQSQSDEKIDDLILATKKLISRL